MKKRWMALLLALVLLLGLTACRGGEEQSSESSTAETVQTPAEPEEAPAEEKPAEETHGGGIGGENETEILP